ncbi:MAG: 4Fe-4S dicluster domain-containing protein [Candidatus Eisenbacteria bacterium]|nr:4Fe-4S dicluster domain-containing protein [Candidatus Eisenbacteria bacterium]
MGASLGLAGLTSCRWPEEKVLPFAARPTGRIEGTAQHFATSMELGGFARGLLVRSYDGRPIKIEGNPIHPDNRGGTDGLSQAAILEMYDPDRSRTVVRRDGRQDFHATWLEWEEFAASQFGQHRTARGRGLAFLCEETRSATALRLRAEIASAMPEARWYDYEPISRDNARLGAELAFGAPLRLVPDLTQAEVIVSFEDDFLGSHPAAAGLARDFAAGRQGEHGRMNKLFVAEAGYSLTGAAADERAPVATSKIGHLLAAVAAAVAEGNPVGANPVGANLAGANPVGANLAGAGSIRAAIDALAQGAEPHGFVTQVAEALLAHRGRSIVLVGMRQAPELHAIGHWLNQVLGNVGSAVRYVAEPINRTGSHLASIRALSDDLAAGGIETLVILGGNPVYNAPADLDFGGKLSKATHRIHLSLHDDETSALCTWHLPRAHFLEAWGDGEALDGTYCAQQPLIEPLFGGRSPIEVLALAAGVHGPKGYELVRQTFAHKVGGHASADPTQGGHGSAVVVDEAAWRGFLHEGILAHSAAPNVQPEFRLAELSGRLAGYTPPSGSGLELVFTNDYSTYDGRFANNGWLQELPDPITKLTWDNAATFSLTDANALGIKTGELASIEVSGRKLEVVAYILPGQAVGTVGLPLGYGRTDAGKVGNGVGFDTYRLRGTDGFGFATGAVARNTGRPYKIATTQDHHLIDRVGFNERQRRIEELVREGTLGDYQSHPEFAKHIGPHYEPAPLWVEHKYDGHRWAMSIDLSSCIGCGACAVACVAENNLPIVGKDQVRRGREMHWIRIDRYFKGETEAPRVSYQPVTCHQCENAPCEQVCPVAATVHSHEGLNDQVYNRCIGTRYCANNCPYKVRRFNYFNYQRNLTPLEKMHFNPEVTVRARGVMEKCTYCVQRINAVKIVAKNEQRPIRDGEITSACAQACPTRAITFGDLSDPASRVKERQEHPRAYAMLAELHVRPRTQYLARLRNVEGGHAGSHSGGHSESGHDAAAPAGKGAGHEG